MSILEQFFDPEEIIRMDPEVRKNIETGIRFGIMKQQIRWSPEVIQKEWDVLKKNIIKAR